MTLSRELSRRVDQIAIERYGMTGLVLMENAGRGVADVLCALGITDPVAICCGAGNNGGDGFVIARHLDLRGYQVRVILLANPQDLTGDAASNYEILVRGGFQFLRPESPAELPLQLQGCQWIVDAVLGTGARGAPRPPLAAMIEQINAARVPILAVDVPSGLDCDTGTADGACIAAAHTCTFVAAKTGFLKSGAQRYTGRLHVVDIGVPRKLIQEITGQNDLYGG